MKYYVGEVENCYYGHHTRKTAKKHVNMCLCEAYMKLNNIYMFIQDKSGKNQEKSEKC